MCRTVKMPDGCPAKIRNFLLKNEPDGCPVFFRKIFMHFSSKPDGLPNFCRKIHRPADGKNPPDGSRITVRQRALSIVASAGRLPDGDIRTVAGRLPAKIDPKCQKITVHRTKTRIFAQNFTYRRTKIQYFCPKNADFYRPPDDFSHFCEIL